MVFRCRPTHLFLCFLVLLIAFSYNVLASPLTAQISSPIPRNSPAWSDGFNSPKWKEFLKKFDLREGEVVLGWRSTNPVKADEYEKEKTLTAIPATAQSIGPGAYFGAFAGRWGTVTDDPETEVILIIANAKAIHAASMLYVEDNPQKPIYIDYDPIMLRYYIQKENKMNLAETILFSIHPRTLTYQGVLPPHYLKESPSHPESLHGENRLGIRLVRVNVADIPTDIEDVIKSRLPIARWDTWGTIKRWPADLKLGKKGFEIQKPTVAGKLKSVFKGSSSKGGK